MRCVGSGRKRIASADRIAPLALPMPGATALAKVPSSRSMSSMAAPIAPRAAPVDKPWTTRADSSAGTPVAVAKITSEPAWAAQPGAARERVRRGGRGVFAGRTAGRQDPRTRDPFGPRQDLRTRDPFGPRPDLRCLRDVGFRPGAVVHRHVWLPTLLSRQ